MKIVPMAWRNIWRNTRRTAVTVGAMSLALLAMMLAQSMMEGYVANMERRIVEIEMGDLQIFAPTYRQKPSIYEQIEQHVQLVGVLQTRGYAAAPRLLGGGLVAAKDESAGVSIKGVDLANDANVSTVNRQVDRGQWLSVDDPAGVVLGQRLARTLNVKPGDELVMLSQATDGSMANDLFVVRGVLATTSEATDRAGVFMPATTFRKFYSMAGGAHQLLVRRPDAVPLEAATGEVAALAPDLDVKNWKELMPTLASVIDSAATSLAMVTVVMYVVIAILILNATLMAVFERVREFGILKALGVGPGSVVALILVETGLQVFIACAISLTLAVPALWYLSTYGIDTGALAGVGVSGMTFDPLWRALVTRETLIVPLTLLVILVFVATLYPAIKAARILPVEAMRHQ